jgi:hypothetical protein
MESWNGLNEFQCKCTILIHSTDSLSTHIIHWTITFMRKVNEYSQENKGLTKCTKDTLNRPRGITLIKSTKIRWFSRWLGVGRLVIVTRGQESQSYSKRVIRFEFTKIRWFLRWSGVRLDWFPGGLSWAAFSQANAKGVYQARAHGSRDS